MKQTITGKFNSAIVFTDILEDKAAEQIKELCEQEHFADSKIRIMPDVHAGSGCVIGTTMTITDKIVPNLVGVDIGCTDCDTEFLTHNGWVKISEWNKHEIAVYDRDKDITLFQTPINYICLNNDNFYHLKTKYGVDQMLSEEHNCLVEKGVHNKPVSRGVKYDINIKDLYDKHMKLKLGFRDNFICEIPNLQLSTRNNLNDNDIRVQVMVMADGYINNKKTNHCICKFRRRRKIERCRNLLIYANINYTESIIGNDTIFYFNAPLPNKRISVFYDCDINQLKIICDEIKHWDYAVGNEAYISKHKEDVDFIQYAFATQGIRTSINHDVRTNRESWRCLVSKNRPRVQICGTPKTDISIVNSPDGKKYCFTTSTGYWIMRRNGCICITGIVVWSAYRLKKRKSTLQSWML